MDIYKVDAENYRRAVEWSKHADTRSSITLAFNAALVALLITDNVYTAKFFNSLDFHALTTYHLRGLFFFFLFLVCFILSSVSSLRVLMLDARKTRCEINSAFSFMNITDMTREDYRKKLFDVKDAEVLHAWEDQTYLSAQLAKRKLRWMNHGWWFLGGALFAAMGFIVFTLLS
ncbi:MAG TPA: hypothetical protein VJL38_03525 [Patescibacteria group bacterium]|nr:hypothetical protein [Patescibacteria group bacterium]